MFESGPAHTKNRIPFVGQSPEIQRVFKLIEKVAGSDSTVLLYGESGTGKEVVAKTIHYQSLRSDKPFIPINCGAIPETLLESELFGHEKGAFTGANNTRLGRFELANGGTIFFDEISEMPYPLQVKLLRVIQEREFERIGGTKSIKVDVRILAATNTDLEQAVLEKKFRNDLFYRLNVIPIALPPLRQRKEYIPLLLSHFLDRFNQKQQKTVGIAKEAADLLLAYPWPGNIRELENMIERIAILQTEGIITPEDLPEKIRTASPRPFVDSAEPTPPAGVFRFRSSSEDPLFPPDSPQPASRSEGELRQDGSGYPPLLSEPIEIPEEGIPFTEWVEAFENVLINEALKKTNGVKSKAAQLLRLNRTTLVEKLKRRNATPPRGATPLCDTTPVEGVTPSGGTTPTEQVNDEISTENIRSKSV